MKSIVKLSIWLAAPIALGLALMAFSPTPVKPGHRIKVTVKGLTAGDLYLANYYGKRQYYKDTVTVDANGVAVFTGEDELPCGIYSLVMPNKKKYVEFVVNEQFFELSTDTLDLVKNMETKGTEENKVFFEYLNYIGGKSKESDPLRRQLKKEGLEKKEKEKLQEKLKVIDEDVKNYKRDIISKYPDYLVAKVFAASEDPEVPEGLDEEARYKYFKNHYWDTFDWNSPCLIRTPVFHNKLTYYMEKLTPQIPDSIIVAADKLVEKARGDKELFKYTVHWVTNNYETSKIMCMDKVFVHMAEEYYMKGEAWWMDSTKLAKVAERAKTLAPLICDIKPPNIILQDTTENNWVDVQKDIDADYTIMCFWASDCGHCKKAMPKLREFYDEYKEKHNVEVVAICTDLETKEWKEFLREKDLTNWINISDNPEINGNAWKYIQSGKTTLQSLNFRDTYDIFSTPVIFVLDKNKVTIAKKLGPENIGEFIDNYEKAQEELQKGGKE